MLSKADIQTLKNELLQLRNTSLKVKQSTKQDDSIKNTSGELSIYDNHPADMGTVLVDREKDLALHEHADSETKKIELALKAIQQGTYGICHVCEKEIPYDRLLAIPYTTYCVEHAEAVEQSVEEDAALNERESPFDSTKDPRAIDDENSFEEVAEFGTSDSPADLPHSTGPTYTDGEVDIDEVTEKSITDQTNRE